MADFKVLIADSRYPAYDQERAVLEAAGAEVIIESSDDQDVLVGLAPDIDGLIVNLAPINAKVIAALTKCRCISRYGVGYDNVDVEALKNTNIHLANVPDYCGEDVSDHAMALFLDCVRQISRKDRHVRQGEWNLTGLQEVHRIAGATFGFIGYGMIARNVHRKLGGFNLGRVLVADPVVPAETVNAAGAELVELDVMLAESDYISLHAPVLPSTKGMIGAAQFEMMKNSAILINTARGPLIDEAALVTALKTNQIACAGLDVFCNEPLEKESELRGLDNVTLVDHAGWYSEEAMVELKTKAAQNVAEALAGKTPTYVVKL
jgi:D-3-phosphoglycerate dehydrogenase / 2-oxoglutarate reductase